MLFWLDQIQRLRVLRAQPRTAAMHRADPQRVLLAQRAGSLCAPCRRAAAARPLPAPRWFRPVPRGAAESLWCLPGMLWYLLMTRIHRFAAGSTRPASHTSISVTIVTYLSFFLSLQVCASRGSLSVTTVASNMRFGTITSRIRFTCVFISLPALQVCASRSAVSVTTVTLNVRFVRDHYCKCKLRPRLYLLL